MWGVLWSILSAFPSTEIKAFLPEFAGPSRRLVGGQIAENMGTAFQLQDDQLEHVLDAPPMMRPMPRAVQNPPVLQWLQKEHAHHEAVGGPSCLNFCASTLSFAPDVDAYFQVQLLEQLRMLFRTVYW
jgi:hypothetical protein